MSFTSIDGNGFGIEEPDWGCLIPDTDDESHSDLREKAHREWNRLLSSLRRYKTLGAENRHQLQRLVLAYLRYDIAASNVMRHGAVTKSKTGVAMLSMYQVEMRQADADACSAEMELGIPPRRRGQTAKATKDTGAKTTAADLFLRPVNG